MKSASFIVDEQVLIVLYVRDDAGVTGMHPQPIEAWPRPADRTFVRHELDEFSDFKWILGNLSHSIILLEAHR